MSEEIEKHVLDRYEIIQKLGRGAYGIVWKAKDKKTGKMIALKKVYDAFQNSTDAQRTYREVMYLKHLNNHDNIVKLINIHRAYNNKDLYMIFDLMETDLHIVIRAKILKPIHKQFIMYQLFKALKYIHSADLIHRDLKPSNMLINSDCLMKLADFGLARSVASTEEGPPIVSDYIATRWYRAPEILLGSQNYSKAIDVWSAGCIMAELLLEQVLFSGKSSLNQMELIVELLGRPTENDIKTMNISQNNNILSTLKISKTRTFSSLLSKLPSDAVDLIRKTLLYNPQKRLSVNQILEHPYFSQFHNIIEETECKKKVFIPINDNDKLTLKVYREAIYNMCGSKTEIDPSIFNKKKSIYPSSTSSSNNKIVQTSQYITKVLSKKKSIDLNVKEKEPEKINRTDIKSSLNSFKKSSEGSIIFSKKLSKENLTRVSSSKSGILSQKKVSNDFSNYNIYKNKTPDSIFNKSKNSLPNNKTDSIMNAKFKMTSKGFGDQKKVTLGILNKKNSEGTINVMSNQTNNLHSMIQKTIQNASSSKMSPYFMFKSKLK